MTTIGSYEAKTHLPALLKRVEAGESLTITRHGRPVARLVPIHETGGETASQAVDRLLAFRCGRRLGSSISVRDLIESGRR